MRPRFLPLLSASLGWLQLARALQLNLGDQDSVKSVMSTLAYDMMTSYTGNQTGQVPGLLPGPCASNSCYYWWEAGAMFGALINYWQYTGDTSYNPTVFQALQFQVGPQQNFNPPNQSKDMGIDDQDFWAFAAMEAAEANFQNPANNQPSWLALGQAVFNFQADLWDNTSCGGGLHWQVFQLNAGWDLKNTISNGGFFQLAARLARFTGNQTYADWANKMWDWLETTPLLLQDGDRYIVWDNTDSQSNCTNVQNYAWSYNTGTLLVGSAILYNITSGAEQAMWQQRVQELLNGALANFFPQQYGGGKVMVEIQCEPTSVCNNDQTSFKAYLARWMAVTSLLAPFTASTIKPLLASSAMGAAGQCVGGSNGRMCGRQWYTTTWDGSSGVGQQMAALSVIGANLIAQAPVTLNSGGTSKSDPGAGGEESSTGLRFKQITTADKAGAGILTLIVIVGVTASAWWINIGD